MHASIGTSVSDWANDCSVYSGNCTSTGRLDGLDWVNWSMVSLYPVWFWSTTRTRSWPAL